MRAIVFGVCAIMMAGGVGLTAAGLMETQSNDRVMFVGWGMALLTLSAVGIALTIINAILNLLDHRPSRKS